MHIHIFPTIISKLRRDVTDDKEVQRKWDFPLIHCAVDNDIGLEVNIRMSYFVAFNCNTYSNESKVTCSWFEFPMEPFV